MRVISVTPAGRRRYLAALVPHLLRQRHVIAEHHWWLNTTDEADARYVEQVTAQHPGFFKICRKEVRPDLNLGENIWRFFRDYSEPDTLYVRLDDDIVYFEPDAVENLVRYRLAHREPLLILGNVVNNAVCTHFHQQAGIVPKAWGPVDNFCLDGNGWASGDFARKMHGLFLKDLRRGLLQRWKQVALPIDGSRRFSINVISWLGDDLRGVPEVAGGIVDEEPFLTVTLPRRLRRPSAACSDALFAHFAFFTQRPYLEWTWPELIGHYQAIAQQSATRESFDEAALKLVRHVAWRYGKPVRKLRAHVRKRWLRRKAA
jgi:hypothetical protein